MASEDLVYKVGVDASDAVSGLRKLEGAVRSTMREVGDELDDSATAGDKFAASIDRLSSQMREDFSGAAVAAEELQRALKETGSTLDVGDALTELSRMGISFDEVTADADKFAASLKQLDDVRMAGVADLDSVAPGLASKLDGVGKSADSSKNALANMIGNSVQDVTGLGGALGVAAGQLAEFSADAALGGEGLKSVAGSMLAVAGPILAITAAVSAVSGAMEAQKRRAEESARMTETFGEAMDGAADDSVGLANALRENESAMRDFETNTLLGTGALGKIGNVVNDAGSAIPILGGLFQDLGVDIIEAMGDAGLSAYQFADALDGSAADRAKFLEDLGYFRDAGFITQTQFLGLSEAFTEYAGSVDKAAGATALYAVDQKEANALLDELTAKADPLSQMGDTWATLFDDMSDGSIDTREAADAVNLLADALGLTQEEVIDLAREHLADELEAQGEAADAAAEAAKEHAEALREQAIAVSGAKAEIHDLADSLGEIRSAAITAVFEAFGAPEADAGKIRDISAAIAGLPKALADMEGANLGDVLAGSFKADSFLDSIDGIAGQMRERMATEFASGNAEGAKNIAEQTIRDIVDQMGGKLTGEQVSTLLGLDDLQAQIDVALNESKIESVKRQLAILTGVSGETPLTASIALALEAGTITPEAAEILIQSRLGDAGVSVPSTLKAPHTDDALAEAAAFVAGQPVEIPTDLDPAGAEAGVDGFRRDVEGDDPAEVPLGVDDTDAGRGVDAFVDQTERETPIVSVNSNVQKALVEMATIRLIAALMSPTVSIFANADAALATLSAVQRMSPKVGAEVYVADYPSAAEIQRMIGRPRIPVDLVVGSSFRITGIRD